MYGVGRVTAEARLNECMKALESAGKLKEGEGKRKEGRRGREELQRRFPLKLNRFYSSEQNARVRSV
jgi:hypothetical protein